MPDTLTLSSTLRDLLYSSLGADPGSNTLFQEAREAPGFSLRLILGGRGDSCGLNSSSHNGEYLYLLIFFV